MPRLLETLQSPVDLRRLGRTQLPQVRLHDTAERYRHLIERSKGLPAIDMAVVYPCHVESLGGALVWGPLDVPGVGLSFIDGPAVVVDGRGIAVDGEAGGFWLGPTLIDNVPTTSKVYTEEIFGPVLSIVRVKSYDEGVNLINNGAFGNGTAIFTNDGGAARRFQNEVEVGMIGINVPIPVPVAYYSFGGWKNSLFGDTKAHGVEGVHFFTRGKAITSRWLDPSHGGINLGFPQN